MSEPNTARPLAGRTVALPETREAQLLSEMLERSGARTLSCPLVAIHDHPDRAAVEKWLREAIKHPFDDLILYTGEGVERLAETARHMDCLDALRESWRRSRKITRGPKPARALRELDLRPDVEAEEPTTAGVIATLDMLDLSRRRVGVQLYGREPNTRLMAFLDDAGADAYPVAPYVYADESEDQQVRDFIQQLVAGTADAIAFTSATQVARLFKVARQAGRDTALHRALREMTIAAVGPLVVEGLEKEHLQATAVPDEKFSMRPLVRALSEALGPAE